MAEGGEKTEQASPKKRDDERKKGNVFMSKDIITIASVIVSFYALKAFIVSFLDQVQINFIYQFERIKSFDSLHNEEVMDIFREAMMIMVTTVIPVAAIIAIATILAAGAQTRFLFSQEQIKFKLERISILKGFKRLFSLRSLVELFKSLVKIIVLTWILYINIKDSVQLLPGMIDWEIMQVAAFTGEEIMSLVISVGVAFGAVAALDFMYQRWEYEKGIRMSKQEVKDEYKQMEGNPEIKSARRQKQQEYAQKRMMSQVKDADVIVRNPTHYAVAIKYTIDKDPAPMVLAKGADLIAQKIIEEAAKHNIITVENRPLARGLYENAAVDEYIPAEFFQPVAEVLAWLYNQKNPPKPSKTHSKLNIQTKS